MNDISKLRSLVESALVAGGANLHGAAFHNMDSAPATDISFNFNGNDYQLDIDTLVSNEEDL